MNDINITLKNMTLCVYRFLTSGLDIENLKRFFCTFFQLTIYIYSVKSWITQCYSMDVCRKCLSCYCVEVFNMFIINIDVLMPLIMGLVAP